MASTYTISDKEIHDTTDQLVALICELSNIAKSESHQLRKLLSKFPRKSGGYWSKSDLRHIYEQLKLQGKLQLSPKQEENFLYATQKKRTRSISGVTPVTVLTKPFPCPGKCIFCPNDVRMPKSYLSDEPGSRRAIRNKFDPYAQVYNRLLAFKNTGHPTDKIELIVLGGTWTSYIQTYRIWYIKRMFDALNDFSEKSHSIIEAVNPMPFEEDSLEDIVGEEVDASKGKTYNRVVSQSLLREGIEETATWEELWQVQKLNEVAVTRCVGLSIETRPDEINEDAVMEIRKLGATKVQIGFQSLQDEVLKKNKRGHDVAVTRHAVKLLRRAGFKIQAHWMPNLYGSSPDKDTEDYVKMFADGDFMPDELKIYPCSLIETAELMAFFKVGLWKPYTHDELLEVLTFCLGKTPEYCRLSRVVRDISSDDIVEGNKLTNFRELAERECRKRNVDLKDIRSREIRQEKIQLGTIVAGDFIYQTSVSEEHFIQYVKTEGKLVGFLRLSLPKQDAYIEELNGCAIIRELHVYGPAMKLGESMESGAQHQGLGKALLTHAEHIAYGKGWQHLAVISAIGTKEYYRKQGFVDGEWYMKKGM